MTDRPEPRLDLTAKRRALLEKLKRERGVAKAGSGAIPRRADPAAAPLSYAQERVWFLDQMAGGSPLFDVPAAVPLRGDLDVDALRAALAEIVRRHEVLRTTIDASGSRPRQIVAARGGIELEVEDLRELPADRRREEVRAVLLAEARTPFDLQRGPLWRVRLLRTGDREWLLSVCMHHAISEAAAVGVLFEELAALYAAHREGRPSPLPPLPIQYGDYAQWQREHVEAEVRARELPYWVERLRDLPPLQLPLDRPRPAQRSFAGGFAHRPLPAGLTEPLKALARAEGATPFMLFLAAFQALLSRYSGQDDVSVGAPLARRDRAELEGLIGFFVNTVVLRTDCGGDPGFRTLLRRVRDVALEAFSHGDLPFEIVVGELRPDRDQSTTPLFQVMFDLPAEPRPCLTLPGCEPARILEPWEAHSGTSKVDLALFLWDRPGGMEAAVEYATDVFETATIERLLAHYEVLLRGVAEAPDRRLSELPVLPAAERRTLLVDWNATAADYPRAATVQALVEEQVRRGPERPAVGSVRETLTYREWNARANRLAHRLRALGVGPDVLVAVCMGRTVEMVTALLAVLKAGGAYVPLDPGNPPERQAAMLEDARVPVVLTESALRGSLPPTEATVIDVDRDAASWERESADDPDPVCSGEHLAYVIFTSGSTGRPKGVEVPHRGLLNLVTWHQRAYRVTPEDRASQVAGLAFDASVWELWPYLCAGASVHLPDEETRAAPASLLAWLSTQGITLSFVPTPMAELILKEPMPRGLRLRTLLTGGDKLHRPPPPGLPFELVNHYGPSESSVVATCTPVPGSDSAAAPPIGAPIQNTRAYLLDRHLQPVPIGVPGELCIAGDSLARGYHGRPDLTAERFVRAPFPEERGTMYRTGDLARWRADGQIEFLGRVDHQVKVRGFRIELGEIEAALRKHDAVREALVTVREDEPGDRRLVGYVVPAGTAPEPGALRDWLGTRLPDYMVPRAWVVLDAFPLTRNGKIDRRALPPPPEDTAADTAAAAPPRTELERAIAAIWAEALGRDRVAVDETFFDLGGHSLLLVQVRNEIQAHLGRPVSMVQLFQHPTVRSLAAALDAAGKPAAAAPPAAGRSGAGRRDALRRRRDRLARDGD